MSDMRNDVKEELEACIDLIEAKEREISFAEGELKQLKQQKKVFEKICEKWVEK